MNAIGDAANPSSAPPWKSVDYWKYDVNMTVNIITKENIGLVK